MIQVNTIQTDWSSGVPAGLTWYFIGQPKTGKTTQASRWNDGGSKNVIVLDTDLGADFVEDANVIPIIAVNPPERPVMKGGKRVIRDEMIMTEVIPPEERGCVYRVGPDKGKAMPAYSLTEALTWLRKEWTKLPYDTVVIDTIDEINKWIEKETCRHMGIQSMGEGDYGADWGMARKRVVNAVLEFQNMIKRYGGTLILISHSKTSSIVDGKVQLAPDLPRGLGVSLTARADAVGYITAEKSNSNLYISFKSYDERAIGSRLEPLFQKRLVFDYETIKTEIMSYTKE